MPGHSSSVPGASKNGVTEQPYNREVCNLVVGMLRDRGIAVFDAGTDELPLSYPEYLNKRIHEINAAEVDAAIEMHFNTDPSDSKNYVLCLHRSGDAPGRALAISLSARFGETFTEFGPRTFAAVDTEWGESKAFCRDIRCPAVVAEPCMITHPDIASWLVDDRPRAVEMLSLAYADGIEHWCIEQETPA